MSHPSYEDDLIKYFKNPANVSYYQYWDEFHHRSRYRQMMDWFWWFIDRPERIHHWCYGLEVGSVWGIPIWKRAPVYKYRLRQWHKRLRRELRWSNDARYLYSYYKIRHPAKAIIYRLFRWYKGR